MKKLLIFLLLVSVFSCHKDDKLAIEPDPVLGPVEEATGTLSNTAARDGCGFLFSVRADLTTYREYAIDDKSIPTVSGFLFGNGKDTRDATVQFQRTSQKKDVLCGWAGSKPFDEIRILSVKPIQ